MNSNDSEMLNEINARIAAQVEAEKVGLTPEMCAKLTAAASGKKVRISKAERALFKASHLFDGGYTCVGSAQIILGKKVLVRL